MKIVRILSELQRRRRRLLFSLWLCIIFASRVLNISAVPTPSRRHSPSPSLCPSPIPSPYGKPSNRLVQCLSRHLCSLFIKVHKVNDLIVSFSGFPLYPSENSSDFSVFYMSCRIVSCLVWSCLVCLPVRLSPSVISTFIYLSVADVKSFCFCHCLVHCKRHLVCTLKRNTLPPPPHTHTPPVHSYLFKFSSGMHTNR